jgi:hypothetical protein
VAIVFSGGGDRPCISSGVVTSCSVTGVRAASRFLGGLRFAALARPAEARRFASGRLLALVRRFPVVRRFEVVRRFAAVRCLAVLRRFAVVRRFTVVRFFRKERDVAARFLRFAISCLEFRPPAVKDNIIPEGEQ